MSYFIGLPYDEKTMDDTQYALPTAPTSANPTRVVSIPTEPWELDDNDELGHRLRFYVYAISSSPIRHALYTQAFGFGQWLSYFPLTGILGLSSTIGTNETFIVSPISLMSLMERHIYLVSPAYYFQSTYVSAKLSSLNPVAASNPRCTFTWHHEVGSGPLMPGMAYYIRTLYSKALSCPVSTATTWTQSSSSTSYGITEQVTFTPVKVAGVAGADYYSYRIVTVWDKFVSVASNGVISLKDVSATTPGANEEFRLLKSQFAFGKFRLMNVATNYCIRPNSNGFDVGTISELYDNPEDHLDYIPAMAGPPVADSLAADAHKRAFAAAANCPLPALVFEEGYDPAQQDEMLLHIIARAGNTDILRLLAALNVDLSTIDKEGNTPLHCAVIGGHIDTIQYLMDYCDVNATNNVGRTPLHCAAELGQETSIVLLLKQGANTQMIDQYGSTPLHLAACAGHSHVVRALATNIDCKIKNGRTPLHLAASNGHTSAIRLLSQLGANSNAIDAGGATPLHLAARNGHADSIRALISLGANKEAINKSQQTPLHLSAYYGHVEGINTLVDLGAYVNAAEQNGYTPLHFASKEGHIAAMETLVARNADIHAVADDGWTPLHVASSNGHIKAIEFLLSKGTYVDVVGRDNLTPLHLATCNGHAKAIHLLAEKGGSVESVCQSGWLYKHHFSHMVSNSSH